MSKPYRLEATNPLVNVFGTIIYNLYGDFNDCVPWEYFRWRINNGVSDSWCLQIHVKTNMHK